MDFIGIGALNLDHIYEIGDLSYVTDLGLEEGSEIVWNEKKEEILKGRLAIFGKLKAVSPGGSAANTIHMISLLGLKTGLFGVLGKDKEADIYLSQLKGEDRGKIIRRGRTTIAYIINVKGKERIIVLVPKAKSAIRKKDIDFPYLLSTKWIHMTSFVDEEALEAQRYIKEMLFGKVRFSIDPGHIYAMKKDAIFDLIDRMDVLFLTDKELRYLFGEDEERAIREALGFVNIVIVKKGERGASIYKKDYSFHVLAEEIEKKDDTGAGDVLAGIFLGYYMKGLDPSLALSIAVKGASLSVRDYGRQGYPKKEEVEKINGDMLVHHREG